MDIVYILKAGYDNCLELRYSLRSLNNIPHNNVYIIGFKPIWVKNVIHIPANDPYQIKSLNALHKIQIACKDERISDDFILMNDDFYITKPTEIKYYHQGTIKQHLEYRKSRIKSVNAYISGLEKTYNLFPDGLDYSLHCPIVYNKQKFLDMCDKYDMEEGYLLRNLYCNHYKVLGEYMKDYKIRNINEILRGELPLFMSTDDALIINEEFGEFIENIYPDKCKYEKEEEIIPIETPIYLLNKIETMQLKGNPKIHINRFGKKYIPTEDGILEADTKELKSIFMAYGFVPLEELERLNDEVDNTSTLDNDNVLNMDIEDLKRQYEEKFGEKVPVNKKNDIQRIKSKL